MTFSDGHSIALNLVIYSSFLRSGAACPSPACKSIAAHLFPLSGRPSVRPSVRQSDCKCKCRLPRLPTVRDTLTLEVTHFQVEWFSKCFYVRPSRLSDLRSLPMRPYYFMDVHMRPMATHAISEQVHRGSW